jgi:chromosome segregation ATPase
MTPIRVGIGMASRDESSGEIDQAGQSLLQLLHQSAEALEQDQRQALETAQRIGEQVRAARDRIAELEREIAEHREQADRAENGSTKYKAR